MNLAGIFFDKPLILLTLLAVPLLWWVLRLTPPIPTRVIFGPFVLLKDLVEKQRKPLTPPWWLLLLRLMMAVLVILALAEPLLDHDKGLSLEGDQKLLILLEDSGASAAHWPGLMARLQEIAELRRGSEADNQLIIGSEIGKETSQSVTSADLLSKVPTLAPVSYPFDRTLYPEAIAEACEGACQLVVLSDGQSFEADQADWLTGLSEVDGMAQFTLVLPAQDAPLVNDIRISAKGVELELLRGQKEQFLQGQAEVVGLDGQVLARQPFSFAPGEAQSVTEIKVAAPLRSLAGLVRLSSAATQASDQDDILPETLGPSAASAAFLARGIDFWNVVMVSSRQGGESRRLTSQERYLREALEPISDLKEVPPQIDAASIDGFSAEGVSTIFVLNAPKLSPSAEARLRLFVEEGGQVVWVAGQDLGEVPPALSPVKLRSRRLERGGTFAWAKEESFGEVREDGPFADFVFTDPLKVSQQILAEPGQDTEDHTWIWASDGTPLVTGKQLGLGTLVFLHAGFDPDWTNFAREKVFLGFLKRLLGLTRQNRDSDEGLEAAAILPAKFLLDGFGQIVEPEGRSLPLKRDDPREASAQTPPGLYGGGINPEAISYAAGRSAPSAIADRLPLGVRSLGLAAEVARSLKGPLLASAFVLLLIDGLVALFAFGLFSRLINRRAALTGLSGLGLALALSAGAAAENSDLSRSNLGYVITGKSTIDTRSREGLEVLAYALESRTTFQAGETIGLSFEDQETEAASLPLIYWPVVPSAPQPSDAALANIALYLKDGGMIVFDTRDYLPGTSKFSTPAKDWVIALHEKLAIPAIHKAPDYHVISRSFYVLDGFEGRLGRGRLWITEEESETKPEDQILPRSDGLSPILIVESDIAGLWAEFRDDLEKAQGLNLAIVPSSGELALRVGINMVLYALTGNYKADQVHVPKILELIGQ